MISVQVLNEFAAVAAGKKGVAICRRSERRLSASSTLLFAVVAAGYRDARTAAWTLPNAIAFSIYDSLIVAAALRAGCTTLYTEDLQHRQTIERLTIRNPFADLASP